MQVYNSEKVHPLSDGQGGTVYAVENGKGGFALTDSVQLIHRGKGNKEKRKQQKQARKRNRK